MADTAFEMIGKAEGYSGHFVIRSAQRYFRVSEPVWAAIELLQSDLPLPEVDRSLQAAYPINDLAGRAHPLLDAATKLKDIARSSSGIRAEPKARIEIDASFIINAVAPAVPRWFTSKLLLIALAVASALGAAYIPIPPLTRILGSHTGIGTAAGLASSMFFIMVLHELAHSAVAVRHGCKAHRIGIGIFFALPVFYADVSEIWKLSSDKRIQVNLAGIASQLWLGPLLIAIALIAPLQWGVFFKALISMNLAAVALNLIPFTKFDGYWILVDWSGIPRLQAESWKIIQRWVSSNRNRNILPIEHNVFINFYSAASIVFYCFITIGMIRSLQQLSRAVTRGPSGSGLIESITSQPLTWLFVAYLLISAGRVAKLLPSTLKTRIWSTRHA